MLAPVMSAARPLVIEGAKQGLVAAATFVTIFGTIMAAGAVYQGAKVSGRAAYTGATRLFRKKEKPEATLAVEATTQTAEPEKAAA